MRSRSRGVTCVARAVACGSPMSLVELPLHAGTPVRSRHRRVTRHRGRIGNRPHRAPMFDLHRTNNPSVRVGVVFPHQEIGNDPAHIAAYAQAAEDLGYAHVVAYDHVVGADPARRPSAWRGVYTHRDAFHEPFVLFGSLAAVTKRIELAFGIVILPQRQTILVAK